MKVIDPRTGEAVRLTQDDEFTVNVTFMVVGDGLAIVVPDALTDDGEETLVAEVRSRS